jgi:prepilin-type N-terminal cleavage/methylation domain-containing protein
MPAPIFRTDLEMRKQEAGFTIIELVVVIILLGIMAATALPRFIDVTDEAHTSVVSGVQGGLLSGMSLFRALWVAEGEPLKDTVIAGFSNLRVNDAGYPYGTADNSAGTSTVTDSDDCVAVFQNVYKQMRRTLPPKQPRLMLSVIQQTMLESQLRLIVFSITQVRLVLLVIRYRR